MPADDACGEGAAADALATADDGTVMGGGGMGASALDPAALSAPRQSSEVLLSFSLLPAGEAPSVAACGFLEASKMTERRGGGRLLRQEAARLMRVAEMKRAFYKLDKDGSGSVER